MVQQFEARAVVIGAGIVGLTIAATLARKRTGVLVVEKLHRFGLETSSRNSEVIHGGLYYPPNSLKARLCLEGASLIFQRCARLGIPINKRGKLVIATSAEQEGALSELYENANAVGAREIVLWSTATLRRREPRIPAIAALYSPRTAVVDAYELMRSYAVEARAAGVDFAYKHLLVGLEHKQSAWYCQVVDPNGELLELRTPLVINSAGLSSDRIAQFAGIDVDNVGYRLHPSKGDYFSLSGKASRGLERLIYPLPAPNVQSLGVHLTIDIGGQARLGPDATFVEDGIDELAYHVDESKKADFLEAGRKLLPELEPEDLSPERCGIRPKLSGPGEPQRDFVIAHETNRGCAGLINLIGIDSPGLTCSPAIAQEVLRIIQRDGLV